MGNIFSGSDTTRLQQAIQLHRRVSLMHQFADLI